MHFGPRCPRHGVGVGALSLCTQRLSALALTGAQARVSSVCACLRARPATATAFRLRRGMRPVFRKSQEQRGKKRATAGYSKVGRWGRTAVLCRGCWLKTLHGRVATGVPNDEAREQCGGQVAQNSRNRALALSPHQSRVGGLRFATSLLRECARCELISSKNIRVTGTTGRSD